jgi:energy-coupling factor transport system ATP-binding protein
MTDKAPRHRLQNAAQSNPLVSLRHVRVRYGNTDAWVGGRIDLDIHPGDVLLLLGPSGCGKSTLLLTIVGLIPESVDAELEGSVVYGTPESLGGDDGNGGNETAHDGASRVGMVFQDPDAQIVMDTLLDEVCFGLENLLVSVEQIEPRALAALDQVGLAHSREEALRSPNELSGGQRQRLAIACALALQPRILVLDEPTANLDPVATAEFYALVGRLADDWRAIVIVEHELDDAVPLASRVVVLDRNGNAVYDDTPQEVLGRHANELRELGVRLPTATAMALRLESREHDSAGLPQPLRLTNREPGAAEQWQLLPLLLPLPLTAADLERRDDLAGKLSLPPIADCQQIEPNGRQADMAVDHAVDDVARLHAVQIDLSGRTIVHPLDLRIARGEFLALIGANGAGKSTLTKAIAGLVPLAGGGITLCGKPLEHMNVRAVGDLVGYVFQNPEHQFLTASVADELGYGLKVRRYSEERIASRVEAMLDRFDLTRYRDTNPFLLSHGEKRRLSVATALITEPQLLILDEPTFGQDKARTDEIIDMITALSRTGIAILMVTHDLQLVADHARRVAVLANGRLAGLGSPQDILCDERLLRQAELSLPPVRAVAGRLAKRHQAWSSVYRMEQIRTGRI